MHRPDARLYSKSNVTMITALEGMFLQLRNFYFHAVISKCLDLLKNISLLFESSLAHISEFYISDVSKTRNPRYCILSGACLDIITSSVLIFSMASFHWYRVTKFKFVEIFA